MGFDPHAGANWLYSMDYATPEYLPLITEKALYKLGDNFAESFREDVRRNFIGNQMKACERFQPADVVEMVMKPHERPRFWKTKRVFFISSYMMLCDLTRADSDDRQNQATGYRQTAVREYETHPAAAETGATKPKLRVLCVSTTAGRTIDAKLLRRWMITNIELQWGDPLGTPEDLLMNKKKISNIATLIGPSLVGLLAELRNIGLHYTWNLLDSKVICKAKFESIGVEQLQQKRSKYKTTILTGVLRLNHHEIMKNFHLA